MFVLSFLYCNFQTVNATWISQVVFISSDNVYLSDCNLSGTFTLQIKSVCRGKHYVTVWFSVDKYLSLENIGVDAKICFGKLFSWQAPS